MEYGNNNNYIRKTENISKYRALSQKTNLTNPNRCLKTKYSFLNQYYFPFHRFISALHTDYEKLDRHLISSNGNGCTNFCHLKCGCKEKNERKIGVYC